MLLLTPRRFTSFLVHCVTKVQRRNTQNCNTTHGPHCSCMRGKDSDDQLNFSAPHPHHPTPKSPHLLAPMAYYLFGLVTDQMRRQNNGTKEAGQVAVRLVYELLKGSYRRDF
jgi:hypothetical protein